MAIAATSDGAAASAISGSVPLYLIELAVGAESLAD
jgi:hypothetical protein